MTDNRSHWFARGLLYNGLQGRAIVTSPKRHLFNLDIIKLPPVVTLQTPPCNNTQLWLCKSQAHQIAKELVVKCLNYSYSLIFGFPPILLKIYLSVCVQISNI